MPRQAADGGHRLELVDDVSGDEVDVIVAQANTSVSDALSPQLVQFSIVHPLHTLRKTTTTCSSTRCLSFILTMNITL